MVYITGDMHGDRDRFYSKEIKRLGQGDTLIICGDFGFMWDGSRGEREFLKWLGGRKYNIGFIDGPHDNFDQIYAARKTIWRGGEVHRISGTLFHLCRGQIFEIDGHKIFTFGGGESSDSRIRGNQVWFKEEMPNPQELHTGVSNLEENELKVDYIVTHEPPSVIKKALQLRAGHTAYVNKLNGYLEGINREVEFRRWYFGSVHLDKVVTKKHSAIFRRVIAIDDELA